MVDYKLGIMETRFAELIWNREPITSGELVKLCERELEWKKSTTYTINIIFFVIYSYRKIHNFCNYIFFCHYNSRISNVYYYTKRYNQKHYFLIHLKYPPLLERS